MHECITRATHPHAPAHMDARTPHSHTNNLNNQERDCYCRISIHIILVSSINVIYFYRWVFVCCMTLEALISPPVSSSGLEMTRKWRTLPNWERIISNCLLPKGTSLFVSVNSEWTDDHTNSNTHSHGVPPILTTLLNKWPETKIFEFLKFLEIFHSYQCYNEH